MQSIATLENGLESKCSIKEKTVDALIYLNSIIIEGQSKKIHQHILRVLEPPRSDPADDLLFDWLVDLMFNLIII